MPVDHSAQIGVPTQDRNKRDVGAPHLVRAGDFQASEQIGIDRMCSVWLREIWLRTHGLQTHQNHQTTHPLTVDHPALVTEEQDHLAGTKKRLIGVRLVDGLHQRKVLRGLGLKPMIIA